MSVIFVVDDEPVIASTLSAILRLNGQSVHTFTNSYEAREAALTMRPDLLISDIRMGLLSGIQLAIDVNKQIPEVKFLFMSGVFTPHEIQSLARLQKATFLVVAKPVSPAVVLEKVKELLGPGLVLG